MTLDGDVDGDGVADVTLDGSGVTGQFSTLYINASNTTGRHLRVIGNGSGIPVFVQAPPGTAVAHVALIAIEANGPLQGFIPAIGLLANVQGSQNASLSDILVSNSQCNQGIGAGTGGDGGSGLGEVHRVTIVENVTTASENGIVVSAFQIQKSMITQAIVANNTIHDVNIGIIFQSGVGSVSTSDNTIDGIISGNVIFNARLDGIGLTAGSTIQGTATGNTIIAQISDNQINASISQYGGIGILGGYGSTENANSVIAKNMVTTTIQGNDIRESLSHGISVSGGISNVGPATQNYGTAVIQNNAISKSKYDAILAAGGWSASESTTEVMIANNTVTDSGNNGIEINGGTARNLGSNHQGASSNTAMGTVQGNTVQTSTFSDIAVFGGFDNSAGAVTGNLAEQRIVSNDARGATCQDGLPGNIARCTFANTITAADTGTQREERAITVQPAVMPLLNQLDERITDFRTRAQEAKTTESAAELTRLAERLAERKAEIMRRRQEAR